LSLSAACNCLSADRRLCTEVLPDRVAICRSTNHCRRRSRDWWTTRPTHNVKKPPTTPLITTAPPRMRQRKSFVHFPPYILSVADLEK